MPAGSPTSSVVASPIKTKGTTTTVNEAKGPHPQECRAAPRNERKSKKAGTSVMEITNEAVIE